MQPIFKEFISFIKDKGYDIPIFEGTFWLDRGFIKAFTSDGNLHKLYKYKVNDDLSINISKHKEYIDSKFETWLETAERMKHNIHRLVSESLEIIEDTVERYNDYDMWVLTSTGKDSTVTLDLVRKIVPEIKVMFNNTSLDVADTYKMVKSHQDWIITNPKEGFYQWVKRNNFIPTRFSRGCCSIFKEGASIKYFKDNNVDKIIHFMGVRNDESTARSDREYVGSNPKWNNPNWLYCLPIRKWSDLDIWLYIISNNLEINPRYRKGYHRVGCAMACPFANKSTWTLDEYWYPNLYNRWHQIIKKVFLDSKRWQQVNCTLAEYHSCWNGGLYRSEPTEEVIQEMMVYTGLVDRDIALKYFNKTCCECGKNVRQRDILAMNFKILGRETNNLFCKKCFLKFTGMTKNKYDEYVKDFKSNGCSLF